MKHLHRVFMLYMWISAKWKKIKLIMWMSLQLRPSVHYFEFTPSYFRISQTFHIRFLNHVKLRVWYSLSTYLQNF